MFAESFLDRLAERMLFVAVQESEVGHFSHISSCDGMSVAGES